jgi:hypothetical protein
MLSVISNLQNWLGYWRGRSDAAHERSPEPMGRKIDGQEALLLASTEVRERRRQQRAESRAVYADKRLAAIEEEWRREGANGPGSGAVVLPTLYILVALLCISVEGWFLAPMLDGLGITIYRQQLMMAISMVSIAALGIEIFLQYTRKQSIGAQIVGWVGCGLVAAFTGTLCWWRIGQLAVEAGTDADSMLRRLFDVNPEAAQGTVLLFGALLPAAATAALCEALPKLRAAWMTARYWRLQRWAMRSQRDAQMAGERLPLKLAQVQAAAKKSRKDYDAGYESGRGVRPMTTAQKMVLSGAAVTTLVSSGVACREAADYVGDPDWALVLVVFVPVALTTLVAGVLMFRWGVGWRSRKTPMSINTGVRNVA